MSNLAVATTVDDPTIWRKDMRSLVDDIASWREIFKKNNGREPKSSEYEEKLLERLAVVQHRLDRAIEEYKMKQAGTFGKVM